MCTVPNDWSPPAAYGYGSESEAEEESAKVDLPERLGKARPGQSAIKLTELGPRMTLRLVKIESGIASGDVLYHAFGTCCWMGLLFARGWGDLVHRWFPPSLGKICVVCNSQKICGGSCRASEAT